MSADRGRAASVLSADVCVVGGGPAGSTVARRLATWGHAVVLVDRATPGSHRMECLPPSIGRALDVHELRADLAAAGALACDQTRLRWSDAREVVRPHPGTLIVDRARLHEVLLDAAEAAGVTVLRPARARTPAWSGGRWRVPIDGATSPAEIVTTFLVDATGRIAGRHPGPLRTAALSATWRGRPHARVEMRVEAIADGWCWAVVLPDGHVHTLVMVDAARCAGLDRRARETTLRAHLREATLLNACASGTLVGGIGVCDASPRLAAELVTSRWIAVGDAAMALDPLASQGVHAALRSAVQASAVVETILTGGDTEAALEFYRQSQRAAFADHRRVTAALYAEARRTQPATAFWRARRDSPGPAAAAPAPGTPAGADPRLTLSADAQVRAVPMLADRVIVRAEALVHPALARPVASLDGDTLAPLLARIGPAQHAGDILAAWAPLVPAARGRRILDWLERRGILVPAAV